MINLILLDYLINLINIQYSFLQSYFMVCIILVNVFFVPAGIRELLKGLLVDQPWITDNKFPTQVYSKLLYIKTL